MFSLGVFYRPPSANTLSFSSIEDTIHLAVDAGINDIIITSDFNYNMLSAHTSSKIKIICEQFSFTQAIDISTNLTEISTSLIDIMLTNNETHMELWRSILKPRYRVSLSSLCHS